MGYVVLAVLIISEVALLIASLTTGKKNKRLRGYVSIGLTIVWAILMAVKVIQPGFRFVAVETILALRCIFGILAILLVKEEKDSKPVGRIIGTFFTCVGYVAAVTPAIMFPQYKPLPVTGQFEVKTTHTTYVDESRVDPYDTSGEARKIGAMVWYPEGDVTNCPLVVFSHGFYGISLSNTSLFSELASNGYVVVSLEHPSMSFYMSDDNGAGITLISNEYLQEYQEANTKLWSVSYPYLQKWMSLREGDMNFVIDSIFQGKGTQADQEWISKVDKERLAVMGHSLGGAAALGVGRHRDDVKAVIALESPYMSDIIGVNEDTNEFIWEEETYPVPVMHMYSDCVWEKWDMSPLYDENVLALEGKTGQTRNVHILNVGHLELTDFGLFSPILAKSLDTSYEGTSSREGLQQINEEVLPFLNYYVKDEGEQPVME